MYVCIYICRCVYTYKFMYAHICVCINISSVGVIEREESWKETYTDCNVTNIRRQHRVVNGM